MVDVRADLEQRVFSVIDARDARAFASLFAAEGRFRFGNAEAAVGPAAIEAFVAGFFSVLSGLQHRVDTVRKAAEDWAYVHVSVRYSVADATTVWIPALVAFRDSEHGFLDYEVYCDPAPLNALLARGD